MLSEEKAKKGRLLRQWQGLLLIKSSLKARRYLSNPTLNLAPPAQTSATKCMCDHDLPATIVQ
jgi:hypothetical protein